MRLTLRYLLAYLDDYLLPHDSRRILEPEDFEAIGKKVQESEFAKSLVDRIRDVVRLGRLGAPNEIHGGTGLDANTVAEYLDNALPDTRVPDFEKVCLESDVHLAEVASCHQVLAMVVTEPVEVLDETRDRIYQLPSDLADGEYDDAAIDDTVPPAIAEEEDEEVPPLPPEEIPRAPELRVPDYVPPRTWSGVKTVVAALVLLIIAALAALGIPFGENGSLVSRMLASRDDEATEEGSTLPPAAPDTASHPAAQAERTAAKSTPPASPDIKPEKTTPAAIPVPAAASEAEKTQSLAPASASHPKPKPDPKDEPAKTPATTQQNPGSGTSPHAPGQGMENDVRTAGSAASKDGMGAAGPSATPPGTADVQAGLMASTKQVILRLNAKGVWQRVADDAALFAGDKLLALPACRPRLAVAGRTAVELVDAASVTLLPPSANGPFGVAVSFGHILATADRAGASLRVVAGDRSGTCQFVDADSVVAFDVSRAEAAVGDPETQPGAWAIDFYVTSGKIVWHDDRTAKEISLKAPCRLTVSENPLNATLLQQPPHWIAGETASPLDQRGAAVLEREIALGRSADLTLRELSGDQKREVRWLAIRSLSLIEDYQPLLTVLDDPEQWRFWKEHITQLRTAVFRDPASAANVRRAMEQQYGPQGAELYELLWKYRADSLQPDDVNRLVDYLGHGSLAFRVLAFWNLQNLYGKRTLYYRPDDPLPKRQAAIQKWRDKLKTSPPPKSGSPLEPSGSMREEPTDDSPPDDKK